MDEVKLIKRTKICKSNVASCSKNDQYFTYFSPAKLLHRVLNCRAVEESHSMVKGLLAKVEHVILEA